MIRGYKESAILGHDYEPFPTEVDGSVSVGAIIALRHCVKMSNTSPRLRSLHECLDESTIDGC